MINSFKPAENKEKTQDVVAPSLKGEQRYGRAWKIFPNRLSEQLAVLWHRIFDRLSGRRVVFQSGRSMIEMLAVLFVMALLAIGAAWGIELLYVQNQRNNIEKEAISQASDLGARRTVLLKNDGEVEYGNSTKYAWSRKVENDTEKGNVLVLRMAGLPESVCSALVEGRDVKDVGGNRKEEKRGVFYSVRAENASGDPVDCKADNNTVVFRSEVRVRTGIAEGVREGIGDKILCRAKSCPENYVFDDSEDVCACVCNIDASACTGTTPDFDVASCSCRCNTKQCKALNESFYSTPTKCGCDCAPGYTFASGVGCCQEGYPTSCEPHQKLVMINNGTSGTCSCACESGYTMTTVGCCSNNSSLSCGANQTLVNDKGSCSCRCDLTCPNENYEVNASCTGCVCKNGWLASSCTGNYKANTNECKCECNLTCSDNKSPDANCNECVCNNGWKASDCTGNYVANTEECRCDCPLTAETANCPADKPIFDPGTCSCKCDKGASICAAIQSTPTFHSEDCSCRCDYSCDPPYVVNPTCNGCVCGLTSADCEAQGKVLDAENCQCVTPVCNLTEATCTAQGKVLDAENCQCVTPVCNLTCALPDYNPTYYKVNDTCDACVCKNGKTAASCTGATPNFHSEDCSCKCDMTCTNSTYYQVNSTCDACVCKNGKTPENPNCPADKPTFDASTCSCVCPMSCTEGHVPNSTCTACVCETIPNKPGTNYQFNDVTCTWYCPTGYKTTSVGCCPNSTPNSCGTNETLVMNNDGSCSCSCPTGYKTTSAGCCPNSTPSSCGTNETLVMTNNGTCSCTCKDGYTLTSAGCCPNPVPVCNENQSLVLNSNGTCSRQCNLSCGPKVPNDACTGCVCNLTCSANQTLDEENCQCVDNEPTGCPGTCISPRSFNASCQCVCPSNSVAMDNGKCCPTGLTCSAYGYEGTYVAISSDDNGIYDDCICDLSENGGRVRGLGGLCNSNADCPETKGTFCAFQNTASCDKGAGGCSILTGVTEMVTNNGITSPWTYTYIHQSQGRGWTWWSAESWCDAQGMQMATKSMLDCVDDDCSTLSKALAKERDLPFNQYWGNLQRWYTPHWLGGSTTCDGDSWGDNGIISVPKYDKNGQWDGTSISDYFPSQKRINYIFCMCPDMDPENDRCMVYNRDCSCKKTCPEAKNFEKINGVWTCQCSPQIEHCIAYNDDCSCSECAAGLLLIDGQCVQGCRTNDDCPADKFCNYGCGYNDPCTGLSANSSNKVHKEGSDYVPNDESSYGKCDSFLNFMNHPKTTHVRGVTTKWMFGPSEGLDWLSGRNWCKRQQTADGRPFVLATINSLGVPANTEALYIDTNPVLGTYEVDYISCATASYTEDRGCYFFPNGTTFTSDQNGPIMRPYETTLYTLGLQSSPTLFSVDHVRDFGSSNDDTISSGYALYTSSTVGIANVEQGGTAATPYEVYNIGRIDYGYMPLCRACEDLSTCAENDGCFCTSCRSDRVLFDGTCACPLITGCLEYDSESCKCTMCDDTRSYWLDGNGSCVQDFQHYKETVPCYSNSDCLSTEFCRFDEGWNEYNYCTEVNGRTCESQEDCDCNDAGYTSSENAYSCVNMEENYCKENDDNCTCYGTCTLIRDYYPEKKKIEVNGSVLEWERSHGQLGYLSAKNWCEAQGMFMATLNNIGCNNVSDGGYCTDDGEVGNCYGGGPFGKAGTALNALQTQTPAWGNDGYYYMPYWLSDMGLVNIDESLIHKGITSSGDNSYFALCIGTGTGTDEDSCTSNRQCASGFFCAFENGSVDLSEGICSKGNGTCLPIDDFPSNPSFESAEKTVANKTWRHSALSNQAMSWWSAKNWCERQEMRMASLSDLGCESVLNSLSGSSTVNCDSQIVEALLGEEGSSWRISAGAWLTDSTGNSGTCSSDFYAVRFLTYSGKIEGDDLKIGPGNYGSMALCVSP